MSHTIIRHSIVNTLITYIGIALGFLNTIWLFPAWLTEAEFGLTRILTALGLLSAQFAQLGMTNVTLRYFPFFSNKEEGIDASFLKKIFLVPFLGFILIGTLFFLFKLPITSFYRDQSGLFDAYYWLIIPMLFFVVYFNMLEAFARSLHKTRMATFLREVLLRATTSLSLVAYFFKWVDFDGFVLLFVATNIINTLVLLVYLVVSGAIKWKKNQDESSIPNRTLWEYAAYMFTGGLASVALTNLDILMIGGLMDLESAAIYAVSFYIASFIAIPYRSMDKLTTPILAEAAAKGQHALIADIYKKASDNMLLVGGWLLLLIWLNINDLFALIPKKSYADGVYVVLIIGLTKLFDMATSTNSTIIQNSVRYKYDLQFIIQLLLISVLTNMWLIPEYGMVGAALATAFSYTLYNCIKFFVVWRWMGMQPFSIRTLHIVGLILGVWFIMYFIPFEFHPMVNILAKGSLISGLYLGYALFSKLSPEVLAFMASFKSTSHND